MYNHIGIMGRLTRDPELRRTSTGAACASFTVACDRDYRTGGERVTDFIDVVAWNKTAEFVCSYFKKGSPIFVEGRLQLRDWNDKDGNKRRTAEIKAERLYFAGARSSAEFPGLEAEQGNDFYGFQDLTDEMCGDLPF